MFEWLRQELSAIQTPRFHLVDGPTEGKLEEAILRSDLHLPSDYREFVLKFGNARLYRIARDGYRVGVFAGPREAILDNGTRIYHIGFNDGASVYVKPESETARMPIFEFEEDAEEWVAETFEQWLTVSCARARNTYGKKKWADILRGPEAFTADEEDVIEARRRMHWRVTGVDSDGNHIFEITNAGRRAISAVTVGIRSKDGRLNGAIRLDTQHVGPNQTGVLHADCYKDLVTAKEIEVFALPDPRPEDREHYWEFTK